MKSHVSLEQKICPVCNKTHDSGAILLDRRLKDSMEHHTVTGLALCPDHKKDGFICMIVVDESKSSGSGDTLKPEDAHRTGMVVHVKKEAAAKIFNTDMGGSEFVYISQDAAEKLQTMVS